MDRASGSGVFARDPDALLDMTELDLTPEIIKQIQNQETCKICTEYLKRCCPSVLEDASQDDLLSCTASMKICYDNLPRNEYEILKKNIADSDRYVSQMTAWRLEGTLREFPKFFPKNLWFKYPVHEEDTIGILKDLQTDDKLSSQQRGSKNGHITQTKQAKAKAVDKNAELLNTFDMVNVNGDVDIQDMAEFLGVSRDTIERRIKNCPELTLKNRKVKRKVKTND